SHVVEFAAHRSQAGFDVAEALAVSELSEGHRQILIPARQTSVVTIAVITGDALLELDMGQVGNQLGKDGPAGIHPPLFRHPAVEIPADSGRFQFKSFLGRLPLKSLMPWGLLDHAKYFTGQQ